MAWKLTVKQIERLRRVKRHILRVPARVAMAEWRIMGKEAIEDNGYKTPSCGTVACIGGWLEELNRRDHPHSKTDAYHLLGTEGQYSRYWGNCTDDQVDRRDAVYNLFHPMELMDQEPQTKEHAEAVAAHIEQFIEEHS